MKKNIVWWPAVVNKEHTDKYGGYEYFQYSRNTWEYWCERNNCLFVPFTESVERDLNKYRVNWQKILFVFDELEVGVISEPLPQFDSASSQEFFVLYYVPEREDLREVSDGNFLALRTEAVKRWVQGQRDLNDVSTSFDSNQYAWLAKKLKLTTTLQ